MTAIEAAVLVGVRSHLTYERDRYISSKDYWTTGKGSSNSNAQKSASFCDTRITALNSAIEQLNLLISAAQ